MMKQPKFLKRIFKIIFLFIFIFISPLNVPKAHALPAKMTAILTTSAYGAVGGALLGLASMAFGTKPIAVAQGASIGLWAGLAFGSYVVLSHHYQLNQNRYVSPGEEDEKSPLYPVGTSPYDEAGAVEVDTYGAPQRDQSPFEIYGQNLGQRHWSHPHSFLKLERRARMDIFSLSF